MRAIRRLNYPRMVACSITAAAVTMLLSTISFSLQTQALFSRHRFVSARQTNGHSRFFDAFSSYMIPESRTKVGRQRVAVCFAGNMRTFYYEFVHDLLLRRAINPLRELHDTDVFFYVRVDDAPPIHKPAQINGPLSLAAAIKFSPVNVTLVSSDSSDAATTQFLSATNWDRLNLTHIIIPNEISTMSARLNFDKERNMEVLDAPAECGTKNRIRFPHTLMRAKQCLEMISEHEKKHKFQYDWIYKLRPDTVFLDHIPLPHELNPSIAYTNQANPGASKHSAFMWHRTRNVTKAAGGPINDQIMISSRSVSETFLRAFDGIEDCESYHDIISMRPPENTLRLWLMKRDIKYLAIPFAWTTVYEYAGPTCEKLIYQLVPPGQDWKRALVECFRYAEEVAIYFPESVNGAANISTIDTFNRSTTHMLLYSQ